MIKKGYTIKLELYKFSLHNPLKLIAMKKTATLLVLALSLCICLQAKTTTKKIHILFDTDKYELNPTEIQKLNQFITSFPDDNNYEITISGHTDSRGSINYNKQLSVNRAEKVKAHFVKKGLHKNIINIQYLGELAPLKANVSENNMQQNRRVEITLTYYYFENISELEHALDVYKANEYVINPKKEHVLEGKKGVKILIKPNTFVNDDGSIVKEPVTIEVIEALDINDFLSSKLATNSKGKIIESGGMVKLTATTADGKTVKIDPQNPISIAIPTINRQDNMEVFLSNEGSNWTPTNQPILASSISFPEMKTPIKLENHIKLPSYKMDRSGQPKMPASPRMPTYPKEPRKESYERKIYWYQVFNKEKIIQKQEERYNKALENYDKRVGRYDKMLKFYNNNMAEYKKKLKEYRIAMNEWNMKIEKEINNFKNTPEYQEALKRYNILQAKIDEKYRKQLIAWKEYKNKKLSEEAENMEKLGITDINMMNQYFFAFNTLGWVNVDRFYKYKEEDKEMIVLNTKAPNKEEKVFVVFKTIKSIIPMDADSTNNKYLKNNVPKSEQASILAYTVKDGKPMIYHQPLNTSNNYNLNYTLSSFAEIKKLLQEYM